METGQNPYTPPSANLTNHGAYGASTELGVTARVVDLLARTKGWVRLIGVLSFIGAAFIIFAALGVLMVMSKAGGMVVPIALMYGVMSAFYIYAGVKLNGYANAIGRLIFSGKTFDLEQALDQQRAFWKFAGIIALISIIFMVLAVLGGAFTASRTIPMRGF